MARPPRPLIPGGLYHVTTRGNRSCAIVRDDYDRRHWTAAQIQRMIASVFGQDAEALRVAACESHDNPFAQNASGASGVFQLMPEWWAGRFDPFDPMANIRGAYRISNGGTSWGGWQCA